MHSAVFAGSLGTPDKAAEDAELWQKRYETFIRLYRGRDDIIAELKNGKYVAVAGAGLTFDRFMDHVHLRKTYAVYNMDPQKKVSFGLFDVDVFPRDEGWAKILPSLEEKRAETALIVKALMEMGLEHNNILIEFPTVGFHVLLFFKDPLPAKALKTLMGNVLQRCNLTHIPFYPRKIEDRPYGDRVQLPLRINRNTSKRSNFVRDLNSFDPEHYDDNPNFSVLEDVVPIDPQWVYRWI
jgi:hypothetical protein